MARPRVPREASHNDRCACSGAGLERETMLRSTSLQALFACAISIAVVGALSFPFVARRNVLGDPTADDVGVVGDECCDLPARHQ